MSTLGRSSRSAPAEVLRLPSPSPEEILSTLPIKPRTYNSLRRYVAGRTAEAGWSFGRLLQIPGFGARALEDVLGALDTRGERPRVSPGGTAIASWTTSWPSSSRPDRRAAPSWRRPSCAAPCCSSAIGSPGPRPQVMRWLQASGLARGPVDLGRLERAARFCETPVTFAVLRREGLTLAVQPERLRLASLIYALSVRSVVSFGLALVRRIGFLARTDDLGFVRTVLTAKDSFQWLDRRVGWFWFGNLNSQLVRTIDNILSVAGEVPLRELAHGLFRRWAPDNAPTRRTLRALCARIDDPGGAGEPGAAPAPGAGGPASGARTYSAAALSRPVGRRSRATACPRSASAWAWTRGRSAGSSGPRPSWSSAGRAFFA